MPPCQICGDNSGLAYTCNECGGKYCGTHRLPEAHRCDALAIKFTKPLESDAPSTKGLSEHAARHERVRDKHVEKTESRTDDTGREASKNRQQDREQPPEEDRYQCPGCHDYFYIRRACSGCGTRYCTDCRPFTVHDCPNTPAPDSTPSGGGRRTGRRYGKQATNNLESSANRLSPVTTLLSYVLTPFVLLWWWKKPLLVLGLVVLGASVAPGIPPDSVLSPSHTAAITNATDNLSNDQPTTAASNSAAGSSQTSTTTSATTTRTTANAPKYVDEEKIESVIHRRVNEIRNSRGLSTLNTKSEFATAARDHSKEQAARGYLYHGDIRARYGHQCSAIGENVAQTYADGLIRMDSGERVDYDYNETQIGKGIVRQWMNSDGHRENILKDSWRAEGIGVFVTNDDNGNPIVYATQGFCG